MPAPPLAKTPEWVLPDPVKGWLLKVRVQPGSKVDQVVGMQEGSLRLRLCAPAVDNKANKALVGFIAKRLGLPKRQVSLVSGLACRWKKMRIVAEAEPDWEQLFPDGSSSDHNNPRSGAHGTA